MTNFDTWNSGPTSGPTYSQNEGELLKQLKENKVIGTPEQIQMLSNGPVYITKNGIEPVGQRRPYRFTKDGYSSDLIITFTSNMSEEYKLYLAQNAVKYKAVLVLRGLLNDSVEELGIKDIGDAWVSLYRKQGGKGHITSKMHSLVYTHNGRAVSPYRRVLIRKKGF